MTNPEPLLTLCAHWPYVDRQLVWRQAHARRRALWLLAQLQLESGGAPVQLGATRLVDGAVMTRGEAVAVMDGLRELERGRVVERHRAAGRRADAWSLRSDPARWRSMRWTSSGREVAFVVASCSCDGPRAVVTKFPDQRGPSRRSSLPIMIPARFHFLRSGLLPVDVRRNGAESVATAQSRAYEPVELRHNGAALVPAHLSLSSSIEELSLEQRVEELVNVIQEASGQLLAPGTGPMGLLRTVAEARLPESAWQVLVQMVRDHNRGQAKGRGWRGAPMLAQLAVQLLENPVVKSSAA